MAKTKTNPPPKAPPAPAAPPADSEAAPQTPQLQGGAYEVIRRRLQAHGAELETRLERLNTARREVFGAVPTELVGTDRVLTANNCVPRDMVSLGSWLLFGYNVRLGLRKDMTLADVFAVYSKQGKGFVEQPLELINQPAFVRDFEELYRYYKNTRFAKFFESGPHLFMVFRTGREVTDVKVFKWLVRDDGTLEYLDNRSDHEYRFPSQHEFEWTRAHRDMQRTGAHPHVSIRDRVFVETLGGTLTIKVEDNTASGEGIYAEDVLDRDQTLDDAEILFAEVGNLILLKVKPYREEQHRHIIFSEKVREARRVDAIAGACVLLPEDHGLIFSNGYMLQTGEVKLFENGFRDMLFERRIASPNGEDYLYVFYNRESGTYVLLSYNIIEQRVETPIDCHGFSLFENGELAYFKAQEDPSKSHVIQIWQTPYTASLEAAAERRESHLFKIGNRDVVRCMAGCRTLLGLLQREDSYANLYVDVVRHATELLDGFFWINDEKAFALGGPLAEIKAAAAAAIGEFEKVVQLKAVAASRLDAVETEVATLLNGLRTSSQDRIQDHVEALAAVRALRGRAIALRDVRHVEIERVEALDTTLREQGERQARRCVDFLLGEDAMTPYTGRIEALDAHLRELAKVAEGEQLRKEVEGIGGEFELLIETVSNLQIDDATQRTAIIETISGLFAKLNQTRAALQNRIRQLAAVEGAAEFGSQLKLLDQAVVNYLDVCDTPAKCEDYLSRVMIQVEELEGRFSAFDDFVLKLAETRESVYHAFETRRLALVEERNKRADTLQRSAARILNSVRTRAGTLKTVEEIHGYFASDLMIEKLRGIVAQLVALDDPVKADDLQTRLKSIHEESVRQLHDRSELFVGGENVLQFGRHRFSVNIQSLELTLVPRGDQMMLHLTGTDFFEAVTDADFLATRPVWDQELVSENAAVYRAEYLAHQMLKRCEATETAAGDAARRSPEALAAELREFMAPRYAEGYQKGVHDEDAARILHALLDLHAHAGLLRAGSRARALAMVFWTWFGRQEAHPVLHARMLGCGASHRAMRQSRRPDEPIATLRRELQAFASDGGLFDPFLAAAAADYLFAVVAGDQPHPIGAEAGALCKGFRAQLRRLAAEPAFEEACERLADHPAERFELVREWLRTFAAAREMALREEHLDEAAALLVADAYDPARIAAHSLVRPVEGLRGTHARVVDGVLTLDYNEFVLRLQRFEAEVVPRFEAYGRLKKALLERERRTMRLDEFKPTVMTSFVRNRLIDRVYLPLVGDNLARQLGTVGAGTRTDRSGMLLLISPPGYGKTTLMEYVANRLGLVFMKVNGPAIGHGVTSLDPAEAPNAAAREELHKLGLALEMGDNVMLYVDDIQHCHPEFLQKFISLCDAQRKIEGVYKGRTRTYDFRGRKIAVVMAGNPYTESGEKFKVPDMLANRADTYNLGDILGDHAEEFELSFLENTLTSNPSLHRLATASRKDVYTILRRAAAREGAADDVELEGRYANEELAEMLAVLRKLLRVRDVVLRVNSEYIRSAGQSDEFRTEPAFRLQGSYRNMNRLAAKVLPVMNDAELETVLFSEYENEAQTLTTGAEANLLKFKELIGELGGAEAGRWAEIKSTFARNQITRGADDADRVAQAVAQLAYVGQGLHDIREVLRQELPARDAPPSPTETGLSEATLDRIAKIVNRNAVAQGVLRECRDLLGETSTRHAELLERCKRWRDRFFLPLKGQCEGQEIANPVHLDDLESIIDEVDALLRDATPPG